MTLLNCVSFQMVTRPQSSGFLRGPSVPQHFLPHRRGYSIDLSASQGGGGKLCCHGNSGVECRSLNSIKMMSSCPESEASVLMCAEKVRRDMNRCTNGRVNEKKRAAPPHISISVLLLNISGGHQIDMKTTAGNTS